MFVETIKASAVAKSLATLLIGALMTLLIKKVAEDQVPGDNFPYVVMKH